MGCPTATSPVAALQAVTLLTLASPMVFLLTVLCVKWRQLGLAMVVTLLVFSVSTCVTYRAPEGSMLWEYGAFYAMFASFAAVIGLVVPTLVAPSPSGAPSLLCMLCHAVLCGGHRPAGAHPGGAQPFGCAQPAVPRYATLYLRNGYAHWRRGAP
jgi:hypothetical protein